MPTAVVPTTVTEKTGHLNKVTSIIGVDKRRCLRQRNGPARTPAIRIIHAQGLELPVKRTFNPATAAIGHPTMRTTLSGSIRPTPVA